jgi:hypothetical protein
MAVITTIENQVCLTVITEVLSENDQLLPTQIQSAAKEIANSDITETELANLILHSSTNTYTGRFSLTFKNELYKAIQNQNMETLLKLASLNSSEMWPEVTQNDQLTLTQKKEINNIYGKELIAIKNVIATGCNLRYPFKQNLMSLCSTNITNVPYVNGQERLTVYDQCYDRVCIEESRLNTNNVTTSFSSVAFVKMSDQLTECFDLIDLLMSLPNNPITQKPFEPRILNPIKLQYDKEILMVNFYKNRIKNESESTTN